jgi:hypothetical protein
MIDMRVAKHQCLQGFSAFEKTALRLRLASTQSVFELYQIRALCLKVVFSSSVVFSRTPVAYVKVQS